jgi:hypothetical protein
MFIDSQVGTLTLRLRTRREGSPRRIRGCRFPSEPVAPEMRREVLVWTSAEVT